MRAYFAFLSIIVLCSIAYPMDPVFRKRSDPKNQTEPTKPSQTVSLKKEKRTDNFTREDFCEAAQKIVYGTPDKKPVDGKKIIASFVGKTAVFWGVVADERLERDGLNVIKTRYDSDDKSRPMTVALYAIFDDVPTGCKKGKEGFVFRGTIRRFDHYSDEPLFCILIDCRTTQSESPVMKKYERPINIPVASGSNDDGIFDWLYVGLLRQNDTVMGTAKVARVEPDKYNKELCVVSVIEIGVKKTLLEFTMEKPDALKLNAGKTVLQLDGTIESIKRDPENPTDHSVILKDVKINSGVSENKSSMKRYDIPPVGGNRADNKLGAIKSVSKIQNILSSDGWCIVEKSVDAHTLKLKWAVSIKVKGPKTEVGVWLICYDSKGNIIFDDWRIIDADGDQRYKDECLIESEIFKRIARSEICITTNEEISKKSPVWDKQ